MGGCSARDVLQRCWGAGRRAWLHCRAGGPVPGLVPIVPGLCRHTPAGVVETRAGWSTDTQRSQAPTQPCTRSQTPTATHTPSPQEGPSPRLPATPQALPTFLHPSLLSAQLLLQLPAPFHLPPAHAGQGAEAAASPGDPMVPGTAFGDLLSPQLQCGQRVPRLWWLRSGKRQWAAAAGCADGSRARSAWR